MPWTNIKDNLGVVVVVLALHKLHCFTHCCQDPSEPLTLDDYNVKNAVFCIALLGID